MLTVYQIADITNRIADIRHYFVFVLAILIVRIVGTVREKKTISNSSLQR